MNTTRILLTALASGCVFVAGVPPAAQAANWYPGGSDWINYTGYRNGTNFNMLCRLADNRTDVDGYGHTLRNNLSYGSRAALSRIDSSKCELANNSLTLGLKLTEKDFVSLDESELLWPRQANGDLPAGGCVRPLKCSAIVGLGAFKP